MITHVVAHSHFDFGELRESLVQVISQALSGGAHGVTVHAVRAYAHNAAQTARAKLQVLIKRLDQFGRILGVEHTLDLGASRFVISVAQPFGGLGADVLQ